MFSFWCKSELSFPKQVMCHLKDKVFTYKYNIPLQESKEMWFPSFYQLGGIYLPSNLEAKAVSGFANWASLPSPKPCT